MSPPRTPTLPQVMGIAIKAAQQEQHTALPGRIVSFDPLKNVADVQPTIDQVVMLEDGSVIAVRYPVLKNMLVVFPGGGGFRLTFPVAVDDYCEIHFQESSIDRWRSNGGIVDPQDGRRFHISDAVCRVGIKPNDAPWTGVGTTGATFGKDGGPQVVTRDSVIELGGDDQNPPTDKVALTSLVMDRLNKLHDAIKALTDTFNSHSHTLNLVQGTTTNAVVGSPSKIVPGGLTGSSDGPSSQASAPPAMQDVGSAIVKVK